MQYTFLQSFLRLDSDINGWIWSSAIMELGGHLIKSRYLLGQCGIVERTFDSKSEDLNWSRCQSHVSYFPWSPWTWCSCFLSTCQVLSKIYNLLTRHSSVRPTLLTLFHSRGLITLLQSYKLSVWNESQTPICQIPQSVSCRHCKIFTHPLLMKIR